MLTMLCYSSPNSRLSEKVRLGSLQLIFHSRVCGMRQRNRKSCSPLFLNWCRSFDWTKTTSPAPKGVVCVPSKSWPSPSSMKTSCSHGCVCRGLCPPTSISKSLMAKFWAPISFVINHLIFVFVAPPWTSCAFTAL